MGGSVRRGGELSGLRQQGSVEAAPALGTVAPFFLRWQV